jgi:hypothetical protein
MPYNSRNIGTVVLKLTCSIRYHLTRKIGCLKYPKSMFSCFSGIISSNPKTPWERQHMRVPSTINSSTIQQKVPKTLRHRLPIENADTMTTYVLTISPQRPSHLSRPSHRSHRVGTPHLDLVQHFCMARTRLPSSNQPDSSGEMAERSKAPA